MFNRSKGNNTPFALTQYYQSIKMSIKINSNDDIATILHDAAVQHFKKYSFHSLYFNLRDKNVPINNRNALIYQLLEDKGGSCYHHNAVFQAILEDNGIDSRFISCLVHDPMNPGKAFELATHVAIIFDYNDQSYLFDPGWNGTTLAIYPLPVGVNSVAVNGKYQIRRTENPSYSFSFEELKTDGTSVVRYDFNSNPTNLADYTDAITYLNSKTYAFYTLFVFTQINADNHMISFVNRRMIIQTLSGEELHNAELPEDVSPLEKLTELLGPSEGLIADLQINEFKNSGLGSSICHSISTPIESMCPCPI